ncbi:putative uncharacterized protein [Blautia hydrogenotrophica CAG:147]|nr:putative uncharacterized protein [Blautia hydrogenotrophica CAG:147]
MPMIGHEVECKKYLCLLGEVQRYFLYDKEDLVTLMRENAFLSYKKLQDPTVEGKELSLKRPTAGEEFCGTGFLFMRGMMADTFLFQKREISDIINICVDLCTR